MKTNLQNFLTYLIWLSMVLLAVSFAVSSDERVRYEGIEGIVYRNMVSDGMTPEAASEILLLPRRMDDVLVHYPFPEVITIDPPIVVYGDPFVPPCSLFWVSRDGTYGMLIEIKDTIWCKKLFNLRDDYETAK